MIQRFSQLKYDNFKRACLSLLNHEVSYKEDIKASNKVDYKEGDNYNEDNQSINQPINHSN